MNKERKEQYIKERHEAVVLSSNVETIFSLAADMEDKYGRDLCEWNSDEILGFYKYYSTTSIQSLILINNLLTTYTNWCVVNGLVNDNQNHYMEIKTPELCQCVDINKLKKLIHTREEILQEIKQIPNYVDQFIILGLFEGIPINKDCLASVKLQDIKGNTLTLITGENRKLSNELVNIAHLAAEEETYTLTGVTRGEREFPYLPSEYIIRSYQTRRNSNPKEKTKLIGYYLRKALKYTDLGDEITIKMITEMGRLEMIRRMMKQYGISFEDAIRKSEYRRETEKIYGKIQNADTYIGVYGRII